MGKQLDILEAIVSNMTHFYTLFGMRKKCPFLNCVSPVRIQN